MVNAEDQHGTSLCFSVVCVLYPIGEMSTEVSLLSRKEQVKKQSQATV